MSLDPHLLNVLTCPKCHLDLIYRRQGKHEELICPKCHRIVKVSDGIPQHETTA